MSNTQEWTIIGDATYCEIHANNEVLAVYCGSYGYATAQRILNAHNAALSSLRARLETLRKERSDSFRLAEGQLAAEKLSGNVAKEEYWKGELAVLHRIRRILSQ